MSIFGGHIADMPKPHRRMYGTRSKRRPVAVSTIVYSIGKHYWTTLLEADNPIWDAKEKTWRTCWDDHDGKGRIESRRCDNLIEAGRWVRHMMRVVFKSHKLQHEFMETEVKRYFVYPERD